MASLHLIVGAGQAGSWAAFGMRQAGFKGRILIVGAEPWEPYERPPLSKAVLTDAEEPSPGLFHPAAAYREQEIDLILETRIVEIDAKAMRVMLNDGATLPFDKLLIATGGRARQFSVPGGTYAYHLRTLDDARRLRRALASARRVVCIGAGVVGLEVASSARALGLSVLVLEAGHMAMNRCTSPEGGAEIDRRQRSAGVEIRYGVRIDAVLPVVGGGLRIVCGDGAEEPCDVLVAAIGMERNHELASVAGIETDNGILVDELGRSSVGGIFAAGDVAAFFHPLYRQVVRLECWAHAQNHGVAVGRSMAGAKQPYDDLPWFWSDQHGARIQVVGIAAGTARTIVRPRRGDGFTAVHLDTDASVLGVTSVNNPADIRAGRNLIRSCTPVSIDALGNGKIALADTRV